MRKKRYTAHVLAFLLLWLTGCSETETIRPGRGAEREVGKMARIYPSGDASRIDRHGLWRGMEGDRIVWEVRYTRGVPTGPYRQWDEEGNLLATWPYTWEGTIVGWARWYRDGEPDWKLDFTEEAQPDFDSIGRAEDLKTWAQSQKD